MPNTPVPAAGEAMPAAKPTAFIGRFSRRAIPAGIASVPAIGTARATSAPRETIDDRIRRLSRELSEAMDEWAATGRNVEGARLWLTRAKS